MPEPLEEDYDGDKVGDEVIVTELTDAPIEVLKEAEPEAESPEGTSP